MPKSAVHVALSIICIAHAVQAQERDTASLGRLFTNDFIGDGEDRWRSGSYVLSYLRDRNWEGARPENFGSLIEYRLRTEIISPANTVSPAPEDRRYAGILSLGVHTHYRLNETEFSVGLDLVATGSQTGIGEFHREFHQLVGIEQPGVLDMQIGNNVYPTLTVETGHPVSFSPVDYLRPFAEFQVGVEDFVRVGADFVFGSVSEESLLLRDVTTGQLYEAIEGYGRGLSFAVGADIAIVGRSSYLSEADGFKLTDTRKRLRGGVYWQGDGARIFYGLTWLGKEFEAQEDNQVVGSLNIDLKF